MKLSGSDLGRIQCPSRSESKTAHFNFFKVYFFSLNNVGFEL